LKLGLTALMASCLSSLLGIAGVQLLAELPGLAALLGLGLGALLLLGLGWRWRQLTSVVLAFALLGFGYGAWRAHLAMSQHLPAAWEGRDISLLGLVASLPQPTVGIAGDPGWRFQFEVEMVLTPGAQVPPRLLLAVYGEGEAAPSRWRVGDQWRLTVRLRRPHGLMNPHGFDYELWLLEQGLRATGTVRPGAQQLQSAAAYPVDRLRQSLRDRIYRHVPDSRAAGVLAALSLGDQGAIAREDWALYRQTGIAHLMAISGLHITMFAWLFGALVGRLWRRGPDLMLWLPAPQAALWGGVAAALAYALFAGWGVPAQRTVWMLVTLVLLRSLGRLWPWPMMLLAAAWVVCVIDPWALTQAGFWLSFVAVGLLMATGPDQPAMTAAPRWREHLTHSLRSTWHTQWVATLGLAPLSLLLFQQVSVVGMVANLLAIPLVTLLITPLALLGAALPLLWQVAAWLVQTLNLGLQGLATQPMAVWSVPVAPLWAQAGGLLAGLLLVLPLPWRVRALGLPLALPLLWPVLPQMAPGRFEVLAIDVGQGTAVLVRTREHLLLYDSGPAYAFDSNAGQRVILPLLRARGERRIDVLMLSHRDSDHVGGAASILKEFDVRALSSSLEAGHPLLGAAPQPRRCMAGQQWDWDGVRFEVLHPLPEAYGGTSKSNAMSCVLRVSSPQTGQSLLLTGDIEAAQEQALVARSGPTLRSQVLIAPHHGSKTSSTAELLEAVAPQTAVFQAGYRNRFGHPAASVMARYEARHIAVVTSADCGAWRWDGLTSICERDSRRRYWHAPRQAAAASSPDHDVRESPL